MVWSMQDAAHTIIIRAMALPKNQLIHSRLLQKVPKASLAEACFKLNNQLRPGAKASPLSCFFGRTRGELPNLFDKECKIADMLEKRIRHQFSVANIRGYYNRDVFKQGLQDPTSRRWNILGTISNELCANDGSVQSYKIKTDQGLELVRNGNHIRHSGIQPADLEQK